MALFFFNHVHVIPLSNMDVPGMLCVLWEGKTRGQVYFLLNHCIILGGNERIGWKDLRNFGKMQGVL